MKFTTGTALITNGQFIDGTGKAPVANAALVIENGRLVYAGPAVAVLAISFNSAYREAVGY